MIVREKFRAFDVETKGDEPTFGLQPWRAKVGRAWLTTCAMAQWQDGVIKATGHVRPSVEMLRAWLEDCIANDVYVVCWNSPFDAGWLVALGLRDLVYKVKWLDGLLLYRHIVNAPKYRDDGRMSMSLKPAVEKFLPKYAGYEEDIDYDDESPENIVKLLKYNRRDAAFTLLLACMFVENMHPQTLRCALIEARCIPDVAEANVEGITIDPEACKALGDALEEARRVAFVNLRMQGAEVTEDILNSPTKLRQLLYEQWGLPVLKHTDPTPTHPQGQPSTDKEVLIELAVQDDRAKLVHDFRDATYCKAKFSTSPLASLEYNSGLVSHPIFRVFGTYTGRGTYSSKTGRGVAEVPTGVAVHQWKRDPLYRDLILAPDGCDIVEADFAGQEFRWMAVESGDPRMLQLCMPGEDPHSFMGAEVAGIDYRWLQKHAGDDTSPHYKEAKPKRHLGKVGNLSLQYRTSPPTLVTVAAVQHKMKLTLSEARAVHATYLSTYTMVPRYWKRQIKLARQLGYVQTLAGRRVQLGHPSTWKYADGNDAKWSHESTAINFPIQGIGADQKYLALLIAHDLCIKYGARFYFELHDGMFWVVPKANTERFAAELKVLLSNLPYKKAWDVDLPIQFPVDVKLGPKWGAMKELH